MSCSLCRLPFTPSPLSVGPHPPPPGIITDKLYSYYRWGLAMGQYIPGVVVPLEWLDNNMFGGFKGLVLNVQWETHDGTITICHTVCAAIVRATFNAAEDSVNSLTDLCQIEKVLGRPQHKLNGGRFRHVDYEGVGEKVDIRPYWKPNPREADGCMVFDWTIFKSQGPEWMLNRPDVFPRFRPTVTEARLNFGPSLCTASDIITTQPLDLLHVLLPYLSNTSFVSLLSTCRLWRRQALTTFQPHARHRVLALGWAMPLPSEYARAAELCAKYGQEPIPMAHAEDSPHDGDWMLYLSQVHRSRSMRLRRHIWALAQELRRAYDERLPDSEYSDVQDVNGATAKSRARLQLEKQVEPYYLMDQVFSGKLPRSTMERYMEEWQGSLPS